MAAPPVARAEAPIEWSLVLTDDEQVAELNEQYREKKGTTDVLSFPAADALHPGLLGDVVISVEQAARQASDELEAEIVRLMVHGLCHLRGHDHHRAEQRKAMRAAEQALLAPLGLTSML